MTPAMFAPRNDISRRRRVKPKFHYADFPETSPSGEVGVMEFGLKGTSRVCRGRHREVGIVEYGLKSETDR